MYEEDIDIWDKQTNILKAHGYTTDEINDRSSYERHNMIRNNCDGYEIGDFYNPQEEF
jgi:hypothetical protein